MRIVDSYPLVTVPHLGASRDFFVERFGMTVLFEASWVVMLAHREDGAIALGLMSSDHPSSPPGPEIFGGAGVLVTLQVDDAAAWHGRLRDAGVAITHPLTDAPWGQRRFMVADPSGIRVDVVEQVAPTPGFWERYDVGARRKAPPLWVTLSALAAFPDFLEQHFRAVPSASLMWRPASWEGIPSEHFTVLEQLCHVRDIEIDGYHVRLRRMLEETTPTLASIDSESLAGPRRYSEADPAAVLAAFREARASTVARAGALTEAQLDRDGVFEGYGKLTVRALLHYLCSHDQQHLAGIQWLLGKIDSAR